MIGALKCVPQRGHISENAHNPNAARTRLSLVLACAALSAIAVLGCNDDGGKESHVSCPAECPNDCNAQGVCNPHGMTCPSECPNDCNAQGVCNPHGVTCPAECPNDCDAQGNCSVVIPCEGDDCKCATTFLFYEPYTNIQTGGSADFDVRLAGDFNTNADDSWNLTDDKYKMTSDGKGCHTIEVNFPKGTSTKYKFHIDGWFNSATNQDDGWKSDPYNTPYDAMGNSTASIDACGKTYGQCPEASCTAPMPEGKMNCTCNKGKWENCQNACVETKPHGKTCECVDGKWDNCACDEANHWIASDADTCACDEAHHWKLVDNACVCEGAFFNGVCVIEKEHVTFGNYFQSNDETKEPIEWRVLEIDKNNRKMLLLSEYVIDNQPYHHDKSQITWKDCSLRTWLNHDFITAAFTADEQAAILMTHLNNPDQVVDCIYCAKGGDETDDQVFPLGLSDVYGENEHYIDGKWYFNNNADRVAMVTKYALGLYSINLEDDHECNETNYQPHKCSAVWWLRSPGGLSNDDMFSGSWFSSHASIVNSRGNINSTDVYNVLVGVRPALWVSY